MLLFSIARVRFCTIVALLETQPVTLQPDCIICHNSAASAFLTN